MKPIWTHLDMAREWDKRGNRRMVRAIAKTFFKLRKLKMAQTDSQSASA